MRLGIGVRPDAGRPPPRSLAITPSSRVSTPVWVSTTGLGGPVVPDVNWMRAASAGNSVLAAGSGVGAPDSAAGTRRLGPAASMALARSAAPDLGLSGTYTPPARQTPNKLATSSAPLGRLTPTVRPGPTPAATRSAASASARARSCAQVQVSSPA